MDKINTKNDLIVLPIGKILIVRKNGSKEFFWANEDSTLIELNEKERKYIHNIFNPPKSEIIYAETALDVVRNNGHFRGAYDFFGPIIEAIDKLIPEDAKEHFYRNLRTLETEITVSDQNNRSSGIIIAGEYDIKKNKIDIPLGYINELKKLEQLGKIDDFKSEYLSIVIHEMLHTASSEYDEEKGVFRTGFDDGTCNSSNIGLTEGMTEMLTEMIMRNLYKKNVNIQEKTVYKKEKLIAKQLLMLCPDGLIGEYFKGNGCPGLKDKLKEYYKDYGTPEEFVTDLFNRIEESFLLRKYEKEDDFQSTIPFKTQNMLLNALEIKMKQDIENGILKTSEDIEEYLGIYEKSLLTPENLNLQENDKKKFPFLEEFIPSRFDQMKLKYKQMVVDEKQQSASVNEIQNAQENNVITKIPVVENNITLQQIEQATENVTISSINNEITIVENVIEAPAIDATVID